MDVVNNRRATFKNIKCNEWQLLEQYDFSFWFLCHLYRGKIFPL